MKSDSSLSYNIMYLFHWKIIDGYRQRNAEKKETIFTKIGCQVLHQLNNGVILSLLFHKAACEISDSAFQKNQANQTKLQNNTEY